MDIAIIGTGSVGGALGSRLCERHSVVYGTREPDSDRHGLMDASPGARLASPPEAAAAADVVILAVPWSAVPEAVPALGDLGDRILVDATNPLLPGLVLDPQAAPSGAHVVASRATGGRVVKAFNTCGYEVMLDPAFPSGPASMPLAGDDDAARDTVAALATELGFAPLDAGELMVAGHLEHLAWLWIHLARRRGHGPAVAWQFTRR